MRPGRRTARPSDSSLLILPGADLWDTSGDLAPFARKPREFLDAGIPVAGIAREIGITRQTGPTPPTGAPSSSRREEGLAAVRRIDPGHAAFADRLAEAFGEAELAEALGVLERLSKVLDQISTGGRPA